MIATSSDSYLPAIAMMAILLLACSNALAQSPDYGSDSAELDDNVEGIDDLGDIKDINDIKRAVLNRLMIDIQARPERVQAQTGLNDSEINEIFLLLSNARHFTNDNVMANARNMCARWNSSSLQGQLRVAEAVQAYNASVKRNKYYMNRQYRIALLEIQNFLSESSWRSLGAYLRDRNDRMSRVRSLTSSLELQVNQENITTLYARCGTA